MFQRVMFHTITHEENKTLKDVNKLELAAMIPIILMIFWIGIYPDSFLRKMDSSVKHLLEQVEGKIHVTSNAKKQENPDSTHDNSVPKIDIVPEKETEW